MCAKCLKQCRAGGNMCSIDVIYYYYLAFCIALCCSIVYKAPWHFLYKASGFYTFSKYLSRLMSTKVHWVLLVSQVLARLSSEMPKMNQTGEGDSTWSDWRGRLQFHTCLLGTERSWDRRKASREARDSQGEQQLQPGVEVEEGFIDAWYWRRCFENSRTLYHFVPRTVLKYHLHCLLVLLESPLYEWGNWILTS